MLRYREEHQWRRRLSGLILTLRRESVGANRIRYPGSPRPKRWILGVGGIDPLCAEANALSIPPGEYGPARLKLKRIDGDPHKQRSVLFNSMQSEEPYQGLTCIRYLGKPGVPSGRIHRCCMAVVSSCREVLG